MEPDPRVDCVTEPITDPVESAKAAGLRYVTDTRPGIQRKKTAKGFRYVDPDGKPVRDEKTLGRIKSLVIPPAWTQVWISAQPNGHLQATGRDVKGRKQSRYHPRWRETRDETKYERMTHFARALPAIRARVAHDLGLPGLPRVKVLATIVSLMEQTLIRVGNQEYARDNKSYGLTTMRTKHVEVDGSEIKFTFQGKSRVHHPLNLRDRRLAAIVKRCAALPGGQKERGAGDCNGSLAAWKHALGVPEMLCASRGDRGVSGREINRSGEAGAGRRDRGPAPRATRGGAGAGGLATAEADAGGELRAYLWCVEQTRKPAKSARFRHVLSCISALSAP